MKHHQPTPHVFTPWGGETVDTVVRPSPNADHGLTNPVTRARCHACSLGKCRQVPPTFTPEDEEAVRLTIASVYAAFEVVPGDGGMPDTSLPKIRRLCRSLCRQLACVGMTEPMILEAQRHFFIEGTDPFGNPALFE